MATSPCDAATVSLADSGVYPPARMKAVFPSLQIFSNGSSDDSPGSRSVFPATRGSTQWMYAGGPFLISSSIIYEWVPMGSLSWASRKPPNGDSR